MKLRSILSLAILLSAISVNSLVNSKFNIPHQLYMKSNYVMAIKHFDDFLKTSDNGALATQAELERSDCYYQLGVIAYDKENWLLASRLLFLANSDIADTKLDDCYYHLAQEKLLENSPSGALEYYEKIISFLKQSEHIPEVLFNRIKIYIEMGNNLAAFNDYHFLWENYPDNQYRVEIQPLIDEMMPSFIEEALVFINSSEYDVAIDMLSKLSQYPSSYKQEIFVHISDTYLLKANAALSKRDYTLVKRLFDKAVENDESKIELVNNKILEICKDIFSLANQLISSYKFDEAITLLENCYILKPNYAECTDMINQTLEKKEKYLSALEYEKIAHQLEENKEYTSAYTNYKKSYDLFKTDRVKENIYIVSNLIQAEKDPKSFAEQIIKNYKKGIIPNNVDALKASMIAKFGDQVEASGWKVYYAIGEYKYEVRYDLLSPDENYYYAWRVNLRTQKITSLNKISEDMMKR